MHVETSNSFTFDPQYLFKQLIILDNSHKMIKGLTNYIFSNFESNKENIIHLLNSEVEKQPSHKLLSILFLVHELIIRSINENKLDYIITFETILPSLIHNIILNNEDINQLIKVIELLQIWSKNLIFSNSYLNDYMREAMQRKKEVSLLSYLY